MSEAPSELGALAHALAATVRRRGALGSRRIAAPAQAARPEPVAPASAAAPATAGPGAERPGAEGPGTGGHPPPRDLAAACGSLGELERAVAGCTACPLAQTRTQTVFGDGEGRRRILFVGEAPGADEDRIGRPFVGASGELLEAIITRGMGLTRADVHIANVLKCRPPGNRDPEPAEKALCTGWLDRQIELLDPLVIIPLGRHAAAHVLGIDAPLGRVRGQVHDRGGRKVIPTYHPSYLLRSPHEKKKTWADIQLAMREAGIEPPSR